jgi:hypothetical protein
VRHAASSLLRRWYWWVPFACIVALLFAWRTAVIGGSGLIGHHGLLVSGADSALEQLLNVAGLAGSLMIGLFHMPAIERSFPITMRATSAAWSLTHQLLCLLLLILFWLTWFWFSPGHKARTAGVLWYIISWLPATALTVMQPSYLYLPAYAVCLHLSLIVRALTRHPVLCSAVTVTLSLWLSVGCAGHFRRLIPVARDVQAETDSLVEMVRRESMTYPQGTRVVLLGSRVFRPDIIAELDATQRREPCKLDLYNFASASVELIVPAVPFDLPLPAPLQLSTEGLREGHIKMAGRSLYFVQLVDSIQQLADPQLNSRFWMPSPTGWHDVTDRVRSEWWQARGEP